MRVFVFMCSFNFSEIIALIILIFLYFDFQGELLEPETDAVDLTYKSYLQDYNGESVI